jgi:iron complex outermembrane receptor protein
VAANTPGAIHRFRGYTSNFNGISGSAGGTYNFTDAVYTKLNIARGFRAPNVAETGSNGIHDGPVVYEIGNPDLKPEQSLEFDIAPGIRTKNFTFEVDVFSNTINNFIFPKAKLDANGHLVYDSSTAGFGPAPVFNYTQTDAVLTGGEVMLDIHPASIDWFDFYAAYSMVNAKLTGVPDSIQYLPFVPPARLQAAVTFTAKKLSKSLHNAYFRFGMMYSFAQNDIYLQSAIYTGLNTSESEAEYNASRAPTAAYTLLNAGIGSDIMAKDGHKICSLYISCDNLANVAYMDYMSRFKYYPADYTTNPPRVGVYNMGRNFSLKLIIPIG